MKEKMRINPGPVENRATETIWEHTSSASPERFGCAVGVRAMQNSGQSNSQGIDMSQCVEVRRADAVAHPRPFLTCGFEAGIVTLTLRPQGIRPLEIETAAVNGKPVVIGNGLIFRTAPVFLAVVPVFVVTRANTGLGLAEGAAVFLPDSPSAISGFAILVHSQSGRADRITGRKCL